MHHPANAISRTLVFVSLIFTALSCDYESKDRFFRDLDPHPEPPAINLNINTLTDTVYLSSSQYSTTINLATGAMRKQWLVVYLNDVVHDTICNNDGNFTIQLRDAVSSPGTYKLKVRIYLSTGTGSIADMLDTEHFLYEKIWWLIVSANPALGAVITTAAPENGNLKVSWTPFKGIGFGCYVLLRSLKNYWNFDTIAIISDLSRTSAFDTTYIGESSTYQLKVYKSYPPDNGFDLLSTSNYDYYYGFPELTVLPYNEKDLMVSWNKSIFVHHIQKYRIQAFLENSTSYVVNQDILNTDSTSYILLNPQFTFRYDFRMISYPFKGIPYSYENEYTSTASGYPGTPSFTCNRIFDPPGPDLWYWHDGNIIRYNVSTNTATDSLVTSGGYSLFGFSVSPNGTFVAGLSTGSVTVYNVQTNVTSYISLSEISPTSTAFSTLTIADNGIGVISDYNNLFLYDFANHHLINTSTPAGQFWMDNISADGQYILMEINYRNYCYRFTATEFTKVWDDPNNINKRFLFDPRNASHVVLYSGNTLSVVNISDWSQVSSVMLTANNLRNIDYGADRVLGYTNEYLRVYSLTTGALLKELPTSTWQHGILLKDKYLYSIEGYKLKIF